MRAIRTRYAGRQIYERRVCSTAAPLYAPTRPSSHISSHPSFVSTPKGKAEIAPHGTTAFVSDSQFSTDNATAATSSTARPQPSFKTYHTQEGNAQSSKEGYTFPIGRALRYIRVGRHVRRQEVFFTEEIDTLLQASRECASKKRLTGGRRPREWTRTYCAAEAEAEESEDGVDMFAHLWADPNARIIPHHAKDTHADQNTSVVETLSVTQREKVERFLKYHMHHVIVSYKRKKQTLQAQDAVSPVAVRVVTDYIFYASLLLHLSALFGFSGSSTNQQQMIEKLLQTVFSCSIFLSQYLRRGRARVRARARGPQKGRRSAGRHGGDHDDSFGGFFHLLTPACANSLHWGVIHFCEGVRVWELLSHQYALQPITLRYSALQRDGRGTEEAARTRTSASSPTSGKTDAPPRDPYHVLLQTHARLVLALVPRDGMPQHVSKCREAPHSAGFQMPVALHDALVLLGGSDIAQGKTHAILKWMGEYTEAHDTPDLENGKREIRYEVGDAIDTPQGMRVQSRRLQLLPLFWTALVCHSVAQSPTAPPHTESNDRSSSSPPPSLDIRAARHALRAVIPLFHHPYTQDSSEVATMEPSFFYLLTLLYAHPCVVPSPPAQGRGGVASATELLVLLAALEKYRVVTPSMWQTQYTLSEREQRRRPGKERTADKATHVPPQTLKAFVRSSVMVFLDNWLLQQHQLCVEAAGGLATDLVKLKGKKELYLSLSSVPFSLLVVPSLAALPTTRPPPRVWQTLRTELPRLYCTTLLRHLAQWPVTISRREAAGETLHMAHEKQRERVSFMEELEMTLKAVMRLVQFIHYKEGEAAEKTGPEAARPYTFECQVERQLLRLMAFELGCDVYPRRREQQLREAEEGAREVSISTQEKELALAIHRSLMSVFTMSTTATSPRGETSVVAPQGNLHPEYVRQLHLLLKA